METKEIKKVAELIAVNCTTCKDVANRFSDLVNKYGKEDAKQIQGLAKSIVKENTLNKTVETNETILFLKSNKVAKIAFREYLRENGNNGFVDTLVNKCFGGDIDKLCKKYYTLMSDKDEFLNAYKNKNKNENGTVSIEYRVKNTDTVVGYLAVLKKAIKNALYCAKGGSFEKIHTVISSENVTRK